MNSYSDAFRYTGEVTLDSVSAIQICQELRMIDRHAPVCDYSQSPGFCFLVNALARDALALSVTTRFYVSEFVGVTSSPE